MMDKPPAGAPPFKGRVKAYRELMESLSYASELFKNEGETAALRERGARALPQHASYGSEMKTPSLRRRSSLLRPHSTTWNRAWSRRYSQKTLPQRSGTVRRNENTPNCSPPSPWKF